MASLRVALAQVDPTVGDIAGNLALVQGAVARAAEARADVVVLPEMVLTGYPIEDLVFRQGILDDNLAALDEVATSSGDMAVVLGYLDRDDDGPRNAAAFCVDGAVTARYFKHHLPNYGVFDEARYFARGTEFTVVPFREHRIALTICEDLWQDGGPFAAARESRADLVLCLNGSPYERCKDDARLALVRRRAAEATAPVGYVNMVGGQDELVFDGDSMVVAADGELLARAPQFAEHLLVHDFAGPAQPIAPRLDDCAELWGALVTGTRDYVRKNGFTSAVLGLSGGIDSAVTATIAVDALGAEAVHAIAMPSAYSSQGSLDDAEDLARRQGIPYLVVPIEPAVKAYQEMLADTGGLHGLAQENLQARVRGTLLMALSNEHGHLVLTTGNKSELATGFSTLYGDSAGGWAVIKDVPKTKVWELARWRNAEAARRGETAPIPEASITKPPSAELAPGQVDEDRLPPYDVLDAILEAYVENDRDRDDIVASGFDAATVDRVIRLVDLAEYKRRQNPPGPKLSSKSFGRDRRLPITNAYRPAR
ncbi:MAG TPA: NAD+ synthase [Mycobacteriales bacterium]|nr:NAD+ synthase [Mycobacteriales bacterium]